MYLTLNDVQINFLKVLTDVHTHDNALCQSATSKIHPLPSPTSTATFTTLTIPLTCNVLFLTFLLLFSMLLALCFASNVSLQQDSSMCYRTTKEK